MTEYQHIYNKKRAYRKAQTDNVRASKNYKHQSHRSEQASDRSTTPLDPRRLTSAERRTLLQQRIMELEDNQRIINNIQNEIVRDKQKSRYSDHAKRMETSKYDLYVGPYKDPPVRQSIRSSYDTVEQDKDIFKTDYSQFRYRGGERTYHVQNVRKAGRSRRKSILDKAEELINARKRRDYLSDNENYRSRKAKHKVYVSERLSSASSGEEYTFVPEDLDSDSSSIKDTPRQQQQSRVHSWKSGVPSVVQVI
jgi:hypothetical protein